MPEAQKKASALTLAFYLCGETEIRTSGTKKIGLCGLQAAAKPLCHLSRFPLGQTLFCVFGRAKIVKSFLRQCILRNEFVSWHDRHR